MIYPLAGLLIGAIAGALRARARGGKAADMVQWAIVHALILGLAGLMAAILLTRAMA
jgi:cation transporter-like permease